MNSIKTVLTQCWIIMNQNNTSHLSKPQLMQKYLPLACPKFSRPHWKKIMIRAVQNH